MSDDEADLAELFASHFALVDRVVGQATPQETEWAKNRIIDRFHGEAAGESMYRSCVVLPVSGPATTSVYDVDHMIDFLAETIGKDAVDKTTVDVMDGRIIAAWVGDESLLDDSPVNLRATRQRDQIRINAGHPAHPYPLCGTVIFTAFDRASGINADLPDEFIKLTLSWT